MTDKQRIFIAEYAKDFNATKAAIRSGYSAKTAYSIGQELLKKPEIQNAMQEITNEKIMSREQLMQFWSTVITDDEISMKDRLKASELLGKSQAVFVERVEAKAEVTEHKTLADLMIENYERNK